MAPLQNLDRLGIRNNVNVESAALNDFRSVVNVLTKTKPDEVYNLSGQSSVALSFDQPVEALESISLAALNLLEAVRILKLPLKLYNACSGECFGDTRDSADEGTPFRPRSPYAVAKSSAYWYTTNYRESYNIYACSGILFNHESPLRPNRFVTKKVVASACRIARGSNERISLGELSVRRDWGWAPEFVEAMWLMMQQNSPQDFVIATGASHQLREFVERTFACLGLDWRDHVEADETLRRPSDIRRSCGNPTKARTLLGWVPRHGMEDVIDMMVEAELADRN